MYINVFLEKENVEIEYPHKTMMVCGIYFNHTHLVNIQRICYLSPMCEHQDVRKTFASFSKTVLIWSKRIYFLGNTSSFPFITKQTHSISYYNQIFFEKWLKRLIKKLSQFFLLFLKGK